MEQKLMEQLVISLDAPAARILGIAGGKGAALAKMRASGLPVPQGFVVTTKALQESGFTLSKELNGQLASVAEGDFASLETLSAHARAAVRDTGISGFIRLAVADAYRSLGENISVAVRSSAVAEDLPWASFAGQYDTHLNITGLEDLLDRIQAVWESLYSPRAIAYRNRMGIPSHAIQMAVVIQQQLNPQASGVAFTRDPLTGASGRLLVNASFGLGEGVVSGEVPHDEFEVDQSNLEVISRTVSDKDSMMAPAQGGGTHKISVIDGEGSAPVMVDPQLKELATLSNRVMDLLGGHQDIEFAVDGGTVHLLQARPVTSIADSAEFPVQWENPEDAEKTWLSGQVGAGDGPVYRLQEDVLVAYSESARICFEETGARQARNHIIRFFNGYPYARSPDVADSEIAGRAERLQAIDRAYRKNGSSLYEGELRPEVESALENFRKFKPQRASIAEHVGHLASAINKYAHVMGNLHWRLSGRPRLDWPAVYRELTGEPGISSGTLLQGIENRTTRLVKGLRGLARIVRSDAELQHIFNERSYEDIWSPWGGRGVPITSFRGGFRNLLRKYGLRTGRGFGSDTSFHAPTWNMDTSQPLELVRSFSSQDIDALDLMEVQARAARHRLARRLRRRLSVSEEGVHKFEEAYALAIDEVRMMENHNHIMEQGVCGVLSEAIWWVGRKFADAGLLDSPDDLLHLSMDEMKDLAHAEAASDPRAIVLMRKDERERQAQLQPPRTVGDGGQLPPDRRSGWEPPATAGVDGLLIHGTGASPGKAVGRAVVVPMHVTVPQVQRGDILVAKNAGPAWTPIFPLLGGLILDEGAVFQHASLIAREYGIPAVIATRDATSVVLDGQTISLDADQGIVDLAPSIL